MHEFKHGELRSGLGGKGGKVKSHKQAIAIALKESGESKYESDRENKRNLAKSKRKEAAGETGQQEREGRSHVGARGKRESSRAMGGQTSHARKPNKTAAMVPQVSQKRLFAGSEWIRVSTSPTSNYGLRWLRDTIRSRSI